MNGDLSLSGSFGGLRIANPDEDGTASPILSPEQTRHVESNDASASGSQVSTSTIREPIQEQAIVSDPDTLSSLEGTASGTPVEHDTAFDDPYQSDHNISQRSNMYNSDHDSVRRISRMPISRPSSALYYHSNNSTASNSSGRFYGEQLAVQPGGLMRRTSRTGSQATDASVPVRQSSQRDRYRQSQQYGGPQYSPVNGTQPQRRSSRHLAQNPHMQPTPLAGSAYAVENGPMPSSEEWKERGAAVSTRQEIDADGNTVSRVIKKGVKDFTFGRTLGEGSYSTVLAATDRHTGREYAIKVLDKRHIIKEKKVKYVNIEKDTLNRLTEHPGIVRLYYTFQDQSSLFFVLDLASKGELLGSLKKTGTFDVECTRFYAAQLLDAIAYMHSKGVIHRDLKPENVLLDSNYHTKITDFGTAKILKSEESAGDAAADSVEAAKSDRATSFVGTAEYVSPELLTDKNACKASDLWAFGCIVFQLLAGRPPFKASNEYMTFQKIVALDYQFPEGFPPIAKDLVQKLLVLDPAQRLAIEDIQTHPFFDGIHWGRGLWRVKAPKHKPFAPPPAEMIKLDGSSAHLSAAPTKSQPASPALSTPIHRPQLRAVTDLPPPSQLDIDWSPVLRRPNERILKLGNLLVTSSAPSLTPQPTPESSSKLSRFFGGGPPKKKQRLVMITSTARLIVVPAGGDEKKPKLELALAAAGVACKTYADARGLTGFVVESKGKQHLFDDPRATTADPAGAQFSTAEWMEAIAWARELAASSSSESGVGVASPGITAANGPLMGDAEGGRNVLLRRDGDGDSLRRRSRFSKRQSKSGLAAVF